MVDAKKAAEIANKIQDISRAVKTHETNIERYEREKNDKIRHYDQQIKREQDDLKRFSKQIDELKRQL